MSRPTKLHPSSPLGITSTGFVGTLWPLLLVFAAGPAGSVISGSADLAPQHFLPTLAIDLSVFVGLFAAAGWWSHRPVTRAARRAAAARDGGRLLEQAVGRLPRRVLWSFLGAGLGFSLVVLGIEFLGGHRLEIELSGPMVVALLLVMAYAFCGVTTVLGVARALIYSTRLRKRLSTEGIFDGDLAAGPLGVPLVDVGQKVWILFLVAGLFPTGVMALLALLALDVQTPIEQRLLLSNIISMFLGTLVAGGYLIHTVARRQRLVTGELREGIEHVREGHWHGRIAVLSDDELGFLARGLNTALEGLHERDDLKDSLRIAAEIQAALLPAGSPSVEGYSLGAIQRPCFAVGGDYYDFIEHPDGSTWVVVADVSGKGYPAALTVANLHAMLHTQASAGLRFDSLPEFTNRALTRVMTGGRFVTAFMAEVRPGCSMFRWVNAGHTPTLLAGPEGNRTLEATAPPLGIIADLHLEILEADVSDGSLVAMFTDGVTELRAHGHHKELYGLDRVREWVHGHQADEFDDLPAQFLTDLSGFGEPARHDDLTAVFLRLET